MDALAFSAPILPGKVDDWREFSRTLSEGSRRDEFAAFVKSCGLTRLRTWLQEGPEGAAVTILYEGRRPAGFIEQIGSSPDPFAVWFRDRVQAIHGMDLSEPMGSLPESATDIRTD